MNRLRTNPLPVFQLRDALRSPLDALPDAELLDRFARYADHPAFEALLLRHGPMVFGVCRRMLASADADDAFQATFLVLIRKARAIRGERLGPWLYGVASRVAMKARSRAARRAAYCTEATDMIPDPNAPAEIPDWLPVLDAELAALPAKYRDAIVLCELQSASRAEAAKALGLREGTLSSRLSRGRELLRRRLLKHGTLLPAGGLAALFTANSVGRATVPAALFTMTSELAKFGTGAVPAGVVPVGAARLTDEVLKSMFLTKLRVTGGVLIALALLSVGFATAVPADAPGAPTEQAIAAPLAGSPAPFAKALVPTSPKLPEFEPIPVARDFSPVEFVDSGTVLSDRDAMQGLWTLEKIDVGKQMNEAKQTQEMVGKLSFFVAGDVWWEMYSSSPGGSIFPQRVKLDSTKNPKWMDVDGEVPGSRARFDIRYIYELDGDKLRICSSNSIRPAEFSTDNDLMVMHLRRGKAPPAGDKTIIGSWAPPERAATSADGKKAEPAAVSSRIEMYDSFFFALVYAEGTSNGSNWIGGQYTVDTTKNPKWMDVELTAPINNEGATKLYGSYEVADGRLKLALGTKRPTRPLEFKDARDVMLFDLKASKDASPPSNAPKPKTSPKR